MSSPTSLSLLICKSSGLTTHQTWLQVNHQNPNLSKTRIDDEVQPAKDGMRIDAQTLLPIATTYTYAPNALMPATLQVAVVRQERSSRVDSSLRWERRPQFV